MKAAVLNQRRTPLVISEVEIADPMPGEVQVRLVASGVCHSDLSHIQRDTWSKLPLVLGHEGAGIVEKLGAGVSRVAVGDRVVMAFGMKCGECFFCLRGQPYLCATPIPSHTRLSRQGEHLNTFLNISSFAEKANVDARCVVKVPDAMPLDRACLVACGVTTGIGAVTNTAHVEPGASVAVIGLGGVGLNVVQGARLAGAGRIIAIDVLNNKLEMARDFGATHVINARIDDPIERVRSLTVGWGADYSFEVIGNPNTVRQAYEMVRKGGTAVVVGVAPEDAEVNINLAGLMRSGKTLTGCNYGSMRPHVDFPRNMELYLLGRIKLDELISRRFHLEEINEALRAMEQGEVARGVIVFD